MKLKYIIAYLTWVIEFYILFAFQEDFKLPKEWDLMSKMHFNFYGILVGLVLVIFWYVDDNFKPDKGNKQ